MIHPLSPNHRLGSGRPDKRNGGWNPVRLKLQAMYGCSHAGSAGLMP